MARLSEQDYTVTIPDQNRKDEVGRMAKSVQVFKEKMIEAEQLKAEQLEAEKRAERQKDGYDAPSLLMSLKARLVPLSRR